MLFESVDGNYYVSNQTSRDSRYMYCSQYKHHFSKDRYCSQSAVEDSAVGEKLRRTKKRLYCCSGFLSVSARKKNCVIFRIVHRTNHEAAVNRYKLSKNLVLEIA